MEQGEGEKGVADQATGEEGGEEDRMNGRGGETIGKYFKCIEAQICGGEGLTRLRYLPYSILAMLLCRIHEMMMTTGIVSLDVGNQARRSSREDYIRCAEAYAECNKTR